LLVWHSPFLYDGDKLIPKNNIWLLQSYADNHLKTGLLAVVSCFNNPGPIRGKIAEL